MNDARLEWPGAGSDFKRSNSAQRLRSDDIQVRAFKRSRRHYSLLCSTQLGKMKFVVFFLLIFLIPIIPASSPDNSDSDDEDTGQPSAKHRSYDAEFKLKVIEAARRGSKHSASSAYNVFYTPLSCAPPYPGRSEIWMRCAGMTVGLGPLTLPLRCQCIALYTPWLVRE
jgi:hypothetical protein